MNELHLFAGAGGGILGGMLLGHTCVCAVEIEPYCREVLLQRQRDGILPRFPIWDDVRTFDGKPWRGIAEVVCGGFPCTDISAANHNGKGVDEGEHSGLWREMARIICEVRPAKVLVENSPMLTNRGLGSVMGDLAAMGYDARWGVLGACNAGLLHKRERIWIAANTADESKQADTGREWQERIREGAKIRNTPLSTGWWASLPPIPRMADGLASGLDRNRAIGNGQVPAVVALAWRLLMESNVQAEPPAPKGSANV